MSDVTICADADDCKLCDGLEAEIDRLRAENEHLSAQIHIERDECTEIDHLRAENAELRDALGIAERPGTLDRLRAENAELREQLMNNSPSSARDGSQKSD